MNVAKMDTYTQKIFEIVHEIMNGRAPIYLCVSLSSARHGLFKAIVSEKGCIRTPNTLRHIENVGWSLRARFRVSDASGGNIIRL